MGRMNLCTQHHAVLSLEHSLSISAVGYLHCSGSVLADGCVKGWTVCAHTFVRIMFYAHTTSVSACFSMLHTQVALDSAWPWASETYGLCRLCAYFSAHKLIRSKYVQDLEMDPGWHRLPNGVVVSSDPTAPRLSDPKDSIEKAYKSRFALLKEKYGLWTQLERTGVFRKIGVNDEP